MDTVRQVVHQTSRLAFLFAGLGSKAAWAAAQSAGGAAAGGGPGAGPASTHDIWLRIYDMLAAYGLKVVGALVILLLGSVDRETAVLAVGQDADAGETGPDPGVLH